MQAAQVLARIAGAQHGVVTREQLLAAGITPAQIHGRVSSGALLREYRAVYRVGHRAPGVEAAYLCAVLACGEGALLHGRAAAHLAGILKGAPPPPEVLTRTERRVDGVRTPRVSAHRRPRRDGLARDPHDDDPAHAGRSRRRPRGGGARARVPEAGVRHRTTPAHIEAVLARRSNSPGTAALRQVLRGEVHVTLSRLESGSSSSSATPASNCRRPTASPADAGSIAASRRGG